MTQADDGRPRVLWVDNDAPARFPYEKRCIGSAGWETVFAPDVAKAADLLEHERFHALILDHFGSHLLPQVQMAVERGDRCAKHEERGAVREINHPAREHVACDENEKQPPYSLLLVRFCL